jgi:hypothetical protein
MSKPAPQLEAIERQLDHIEKTGPCAAPVSRCVAALAEGPGYATGYIAGLHVPRHEANDALAVFPIGTALSWLHPFDAPRSNRVITHTYEKCLALRWRGRSKEPVADTAATMAPMKPSFSLSRHHVGLLL